MAKPKLTNEQKQAMFDKAVGDALRNSKALHEHIDSLIVTFRDRPSELKVHIDKLKMELEANAKIQWYKAERNAILSKLTDAKKKGSAANRNRSDICFDVFRQYLTDNNLTDDFISSKKASLEHWIKPHTATLFKLAASKHPPGKKKNIKFPTSESALYNYQKKLKAGQ